MKTLVSRLSVACHHRSGKYRTCRERVPWAPGGTPRIQRWLGRVGGCPLHPPEGSSDTRAGGTHLPGAQGALQRPLGRRQCRVCAVEPGQRRLVGVEVGCFLRWVQKPALENTGGEGDTTHPHFPSGSAPRGASPCSGDTCWGLSPPPSPNIPFRAQFSPSYRRSPQSNRGRASERERRSQSLW